MIFINFLFFGLQEVQCPKKKDNYRLTTRGVEILIESPNTNKLILGGQCSYKTKDT